MAGEIKGVFNSPRNARKNDPFARKGIGAVSKAKLNEQGILTFAQVAALSPEKLKKITGGRVNAQAVIEQAQNFST